MSRCFIAWFYRMVLSYGFIARFAVLVAPTFYGVGVECPDYSHLQSGKQVLLQFNERAGLRQFIATD